MITALATGDDGKQIIVLGLSYENLKRLRDGKPIHVRSDVHAGFPENLAIMIFAGATERAMAEQLQPLISAATKVIAVPRDHDKPKG